MKGIIYIMTTAVPGLIKIGKTRSANFEQRMYDLEHTGYCNVTALKRTFAIEVDDYDEKEAMLHTIFEKSQVANTELFALDVNIALQLMSSLDGEVVFPKESKDEIFITAVDNSNSRLIPNGKYVLKRLKRSDNKTVEAYANINNGIWTLLKDSVLGICEDVGVSNKAKEFRTVLPLDENGRLLNDVELGECSPSFASDLVMNQSTNGWNDWKDENGNSVDIYRKKDTKHEDNDE